MDAIESQAQFIHCVSGKNVSFIQSEDLATSLACIAEAGNGISLERRFLAQVLLDGVITVQAIVLAEIMANVERPLIQVYRSGG